MNAQPLTPHTPASIPRTPSGPRAIVCERTGRWAAALRREPAAPARLYEVRSLSDCLQTLRQRPASFLIVELEWGHIEPLLAHLARAGRDFPLSSMAVVADRSLAGYEELFREAGAIWFCTSPRQLAPLAEAAQRHLQMAPTPPLGTIERIWASLPWGKAE